MATSLRRIILLLAMLAGSACTDRSPDPVRSAPLEHTRDIVAGAENVVDAVWFDSITAANGGFYAVDTTVVGVSEPWQIDSSIDAYVSQTQCRTAPRGATLSYDGGSGLMHFALPGPLVFVDYNRGVVNRPDGIFRRAIYETRQEVRAIDPAGHTWRFIGRFNALCRRFVVQTGPIRVETQVVVPQTPITGPRLVGGGGGYWGGGEECGTGVDEEEATYESGVYSPPPPSGCGSGSGGAPGGQPLAEDEWYAWYEGIRFRCHREDNNTGMNIVSCTVDN
ncbi:hypothetical protein [Longimicrobium terrae]|uniref:Lipoprotein n=1 Tax=Longimicrobium terrae TaxID=1639882 RepID=A0A841H1K0_9BACT|nr:hypothetical protein [Longimicrobium terrae]MBB4637482.1 hypothetical protein [Longimicrobium terrae]MBB6071880.1 hypothetical protein [Longimicrobium terrae]NNC30428.1 hypothetical protein [Longimicrobium terrae]